MRYARRGSGSCSTKPGCATTRTSAGCATSSAGAAKAVELLDGLLAAGLLTAEEHGDARETCLRASPFSVQGPEATVEGIGPRRALDSGFRWEASARGFEYWMKVYNGFPECGAPDAMAEWRLGRV